MNVSTYPMRGRASRSGAAGRCHGARKQEETVKTLALCLASLALIAAASPASARSPGGHCPPAVSGYQHWDVTTEPYQVDNRLDEAGNNNGMVCALPTKITVDENGEPFQGYNFIEDAGNLP
jgi:hypothetical protein